MDLKTSKEKFWHCPTTFSISSKSGIKNMEFLQITQFNNIFLICILNKYMLCDNLISKLGIFSGVRQAEALTMMCDAKLSF